jgi:hypothetical protein
MLSAERLSRFGSGFGLSPEQGIEQEESYLRFLEKQPLTLVMDCASSVILYRMASQLR